MACFEHSNFLKVKVPVPRCTPVKGTPAHQEVRPVQAVHAVKRTTQPGLNFSYGLFNCNNFNIRYWSWNYRGCWPLFNKVRARLSAINSVFPTDSTQPEVAEF